MSEYVFHKLTESQKSIWFLENAHPGTSINVVAGNLRFKGNVDYAALEKSLNIFVKTNDSMRIHIVEKDGVASQYIEQFSVFKVDFFDFSKSGGLKALFSWDEEKTKEPFDIIDNPLYYCALFKISDEEGGFYMKMHHLISDAWTMGLLGRQVVDLYSKLKRGQPVDEMPYPSYIDHIRQEEAYEKSTRFEKDARYWNEKFETLPEMTVLKPQKQGETSIRAKRKTMITPAKFSNKLREFSKENNLSVFTLFMAALTIYINRVAGFRDMVLGTTVLNRINSKDKQTTGMFVSVAAPVRVTLDDTMDFTSFAKVMLKENTEVLKHQKYPYNYLIRDLKKRHKFSNRLFDIVLSYQNSKFHKNESEEEYIAKWLYSGYQIESLVISINDREDNGDLIIDYDFLTDVFLVKEIEFIHQHILRLLWHALDNPARCISKLEMISEKEKHTILREFNDTAAEFPKDKTIHQIFEEQAEKTPDNIALVFNDETMTYKQLNEKANRLAHTLRANGVGPDDVVGIIIERSFEMIISILGILKSGGAYMPIDPGCPMERKAYMLENSGAKALVTKRSCLSDISYNGLIIDLEDETSFAPDDSNPENVNKPSDLLYIIYTSGSTGRPKGVMIEHRNVVGLYFNDRFGFDFNMYDVFTVFHSYCFDMASWELFGALLFGAKLIIIKPEVTTDLYVFLELIKKEKVTVITQTPRCMYSLIDMEMQSEQKDLSLRHICLGGEALSPSHLKPLKDKYPNIAFHNLYGPTETTMFVTHKRLEKPEEFTTELSNIGFVNPLTKVYITDGNMNLVPIGIAGELCISGNCVSRGYINNPELTSEKYVENPFAPGEIIYKTGDLARIMPKGELIYLGRTDSQVKIRGYRIELGEIENAIIKQAGADEVIVTVRESETGDKNLCAYYKSKSIMSAAEIKDKISAKLPNYMIPSFFVRMESFPLNKNGKIDIKALPEPNEEINRSDFVIPKNAIEIELIKIWEKVLGIHHISVSDNFFYIGGDSLNALKVQALVKKALNCEISPRDLFRYSTIQELGEYISSLTKTYYEPIIKADIAEYYPVSSAQKRQYLLNRINGGISYNQPGGLNISGEINADKIKQAFHEIVRRHESLRTSFEWRNGEPVQIVHTSADFDLEHKVLKGKYLDEGIIRSFVKPFDLSQAPLIRCQLVSFSAMKHVLLFDMHHIISDGTSIAILVREFVHLYNGEQLPELSVQYKDYSAWHNKLLQSEDIKRQEVFWLDMFSGELPILNLPLDFPRPAVQSYKGNRLNFAIDEQLTNKVKELSQKTGTTLFMLLFAVYNILLFRYSGQEDIIVGIPVEGRRHEDLRNIIGMFVNTLAVRSFPEASKVFEVFLSELKEELLNIFDNQEYPFEELVEKIGVKRDASRNPIFSTMFALQNADLSELGALGFSIEPFMCNNQTAKFDLTFEAVDKGKTIEYGIEYCTDLFNEETIKRLSNHFINIIADITEHPSKKLKDVDILSEKERHQLLVEFNDTAAEFPKDKTIHQIFEEQAEKTPDNIALVFNDETMTYKQLNEKADRLAHTLRANGVGPDDVVGIIIDRSFEMIISIMGILKSGGAYMPIDPDYPVERKLHMLTNSNSKLLVTTTGFDLDFSGNILYVDIESTYSSEYSNLALINQSSDLAYIIYTSGSTGKPKGVMMEHRNLVGLLFNNRFFFDVSINDVWTQFHSYCFDFSALEIYGALLRGGKLVIVPQEATKDLMILVNILIKNKVTVLCQTPHSMYNLVDTEVQSKNEALCLRYIIIGGEVLKPRFLIPIKDKYPDTEFINIYGPTETTIFVTKKWLKDAMDFDTDLINIGPVNPLTNIYILDKNLNLVPIGVPGELYITGNGVSRGYINNSQLTEKRFLDNSYTKESTMYKTGDIARWLPTGDLNYIGRIDNQVKIRGFRIELGEIESVLLKHKDIEEAVVVVIETSIGDKKLCAYYKAGFELTLKDIQTHMRQSLPFYMVPAFFVRIDSFPLSRNKKIDKSKLPKPHEAISKSNRILPRNKMEKTIAEVWSEVLEISAVGIDDNFFELGGDSLNAVKIVTKLKLGIKLVDFYSYPTIRLIAEKLLTNNKKAGLLVDMSRNYASSNISVICIPFGGGSPISYTRISESISDKKANLNIYSVNIPGYDYGTPEELKRTEEVAKLLATEIQENISGEVILYGHCAGSALTIETARILEKMGVNIKALFIGAIFAPRHIKLYGWFNKPVGFYTDNSIRRFLKTAGLSEDMLDNKDYLQHMRRVLRYAKLDYNRYFYHLGTSKTDKISTPLYLVVGDKDIATRHYHKKFLLWKRYVENVQLLVLKNAKHFFITTHSDQLVDYLIDI